MVLINLFEFKNMELHHGIPTKAGFVNNYTAKFRNS